MAYNRLKHTFTAGELSDLMDARTDFERYKNGCKKMYNAFCLTQGPVTRRPGLRLLAVLNEYLAGLDAGTPVRLIPFIFSTARSYVLIFVDDSIEGPVMLVAASEGIVEDPTNPGNPLKLDLPSAWDVSYFDYTQSADEVYIAQRGLAPHIIRRTSSTSWQLVAITFNDQPAVWSTAGGWPSKCVFHQQRLFFAATDSLPRTVWATKAGDFNSFGTSQPLIDSDAITFTLDSGTQNSIKWLVSSKTLSIGTAGSEWTVVGSNQTALTPLNVYAREQTSVGSEQLKPLKIGHAAIFLEEHGRVVNEFAYSYADDGYVTNDLTVLAEHLTREYSIVDWTYQRTPHNVIWSVREDGELLGLTYQRQHKVVGWHDHSTEGNFRATATIPGNGREDVTFFIVERESATGTKMVLERFGTNKLPNTAGESRYLDSYIELNNGVATAEGDMEFSLAKANGQGLLYDGGLPVILMTEGIIIDMEYTISDGKIVLLNSDVDNLVVGLPYTSEVIPCLSDLPTAEGSTLGRAQVIVELNLNLYKTLGCSIGRIDSDDGSILMEEIPFRTPSDLTGMAVPLYTNTKRITFPEGVDTDSDYFIRQEYPLPLTIRSAVDYVEVYE